MHPILFRIPLPWIGTLPIYSYGVMLGLSLVVGWYLTLGLAERDGLPKDTMANNYVITAAAAILGSRVLYILTNLSEFEGDLGKMLAFRNGGLVAYGGFIGGFLGSWAYLRFKRIQLMPWADVAVPSLASGLMITRIGCYLFGCDFGRPLAETAPGWLKTLGTFPHWADGTLEHGSGSPAWVQHVKERGLSPLSEASLPVHPTQIYESLVGLGLLVFLLVMRKRQKFRGEIFFLFTFAYGVCRYLLELLRDDAERGSLPPALPEHLLLPLGLAIFALGYVIGFSKLVDNPVMRRLTQVLAFVPAIVLYLALSPESFASSAVVQWSTSQVVGLSSAFAVALAFNVFHKAALDHPESAMALHLPDYVAPGAAAAASDDDEDDDEDEDDAPAPVEKAAAGKGGKKPARAAKKADADVKKAGADVKKPAAAEDEKAPSSSEDGDSAAQDDEAK